MIEKLGFTETLKSRTKLVADGLEMMALITEGQVELGYFKIITPTLETRYSSSADAGFLMLVRYCQDVTH